MVFRNQDLGKVLFLPSQKTELKTRCGTPPPILLYLSIFIQGCKCILIAAQCGVNLVGFFPFVVVPFYESEKLGPGFPGRFT